MSAHAGERLVAGDDLLVQPAEPRRRLHAEFLAKPGLQQLVGPKGIGLTTRPVQRDHELPRQMFLQRVLANEAFEFGHQLPRHPPLQIGIDACLDRFEAQLLETSDLALRERFVGEVLEWSPPPERQRLPEHQRRGSGIGLGQRPTLRTPAARSAPSRPDPERSRRDTQEHE